MFRSKWAIRYITTFRELQMRCRRFEKFPHPEIHKHQTLAPSYFKIKLQKSATVCFVYKAKFSASLSLYDKRNSVRSFSLFLSTRSIEPKEKEKKKERERKFNRTETSKSVVISVNGEWTRRAD